MHSPLGRHSAGGEGALQKGMGVGGEGPRSREKGGQLTAEPLVRAEGFEER